MALSLGVPAVSARAASSRAACERPVILPTAGAASLMATRRQRAKQRQPPQQEPAADYEHIGVVLRLRPLLRWERREGFTEAVSKYADAALQVDGP